MNPASRSAIRALGFSAALLAATGCDDLRAQSGLAGRVAAAPDGDVRFSFAARPGVCGDGTTFFSIDGGTYIGTVTSIETARGSCAPGPVRVVLDRAGGQVIGVRTFVGPVSQPAEAATDFGEIPPRDAADYLLGIAATADGRPGRDAITPAALAQGVDVGDRLIAIARDANRPLDTRRAAMSWLGRGASTPDAARRASAALLDLVRSGSLPHAVRRHALTTLARLDGGAGVPAVIALAGSPDDAWVTREAVAALARSGDPRARESLREVVRRGTLPDEPTSVAIRGLAGEYATAQDAALLRDRFVQLQGERSRRAVVTAMTERGGAENARWLLQVAAHRFAFVAPRYPVHDAPVQARRRSHDCTIRGTTSRGRWS